MSYSLEAKSIIENIQRQKTGCGLKGLEDPETSKAWEEKNQELNNALQKLSEDLYKKKTHFVMELIQNAEDNDYDPDDQSLIKFSIKPDILIVYNNENGFTPDDVEGICSVGQTKKSKNRAGGYIGEKGIGFKSVFKISDSPKIISNGFQFEFKRQDGDNLGYIVPYWLHAIPGDVDQRITNIILPLRDDARERLNLFDEIDSTLILFLRKLQRIEIFDNVNNTSKIITKAESNGQVTIVCQNRSQFWRVIRTAFSVPQEISEKELERKGIIDTEIVLAFPVNESGLPEKFEVNADNDIFAFLPVKRCGLKFILQADFLLTSNREDIQQDADWNEWLVSKIPEVVIRAIEEFKRDEKLKTSIFKYISHPEEINDEFINPLAHHIFQALQDVECILTESGSWRKPCDVYFADKDIKTLISNDELLHAFGKEYVADSFYLKKDFRDLLKIEDITPRRFFECLKKAEWVKQHSDEWFIRLYRYLGNQLKQTKPNLTINEIIQLPIIKLENGECCPANSGKILFFLEKTGKKYGFESDLEEKLRVMNANIRMAIRTEEDARDLEEFLKRLNVTYPSPRAIIDEYILPQYQNGSWREKTRETLQGHIFFIKDNFEKLREIDGYIEKIGKYLHLRINGKQDSNNYGHPRQIYLPDEYGNDYHLSSVMAAAGDSYFHENSLHSCYIESDLKSVDAKVQEILAEAKPKRGKRTKKHSQIKKQIEELEKTKPIIVSAWKEFVLALGVHEGIIVSLDTETILVDGGDYAKNTVTEKRIYRYELGKTIWKDSGWKETVSSYYLQNDYRSVDFDRVFHQFNIVEPGLKRRISSMLFQILLNNWVEYRKYKECKYYYRLSGWHGWGSESTQTTFLHKLKTFPWAMTTEGDFVPLKDIYLNDNDIRKILGSLTHYIGFSLDKAQHADFIKDMGIRTEANISDIMGVLANKVRSGSDNIEEFRFLYANIQKLMKQRDAKYYTAQNAFRDQPLIFVPETDKKYFSAKEVFWDDQDELKEYIPALSPWYPDCKAFFLNYINIKEVPGPEDLIAVLERIAQKNEISEDDRRKVVTIYKELNAVLKRTQDITNAEWLKDFNGKALLLVDKREFWQNDKGVFINDDSELDNLFSDREDIAFLAIDLKELRDLDHFIKSLKIPRLSDSVKYILADGDHPVHEDDPMLSLRIKELVPYILRYLYHKHPDNYDHF